MCNQNCWGGNSCFWIIAIILLVMFCGNGCGGSCNNGCNNNCGSCC